MLKVSIITVTFNSDSTLIDAIESVVEQDYPCIEYIVVDGNSTDSTNEIIESYFKKNVINKFVSEPDSGIYDAMNKGLSMATGDLIGILNSDDLFAGGDVISTLVASFSDETDVVLSGVNFFEGGNKNKFVRCYPVNNFYRWMLHFGVMPPHPGAYIRKNVYREVGLYKKNLTIASDFDFFVRLFFKHRFNIKKLNFTSVYMREGGASTSGFQSKKTISKEILQSLTENGIYSNKFFIFLRFLLKLRQVL